MENFQYTNFSSYDDAGTAEGVATQYELYILLFYVLFAPSVIFFGLTRAIDYFERRFHVQENEILHFGRSRENRVPRDYKPLFDAAIAAAVPDAREGSGGDGGESEEVWKTRVLFEYIPSRGSSLIMYYDVYREGFAYYCDLQSIPYDVLNEIARKYVVLFDCVRFFAGAVTTAAIPKEAASNDSVVAEENISLSKLRNASYKVNTIAGRFSTGGGGGGSNAPASIAEGEATEVESKKNKFIRIGKVIDFQFLKKPPVAKIEPKRNITYSSFRELFA